MTGPLHPNRPIARGLVTLLLSGVLLTGCPGPFERAVMQDAASIAAPAESRRAALEAARSKIGAPYEWAANGPNAFDCSGLIVWAYQEAVGSAQIFRGEDEWNSDVTMDQLHKFGTQPLLPAEMQPGDLVFITSSQEAITHGGLFVRWVTPTELELIHASSYHKRVVLSAWSTDHVIREQWFAGGGRLLLPE
jgi:cell wall-associated NlpC family hydrolase